MTTIRREHPCDALGLLMVFALVALAVGCESPHPATQPSTKAAISEFNDLLATRGRVAFLSWNGKWIGMDGDTDITFLPAGAVEMTEYGYSVRNYKGTYQLDGDGVISIQLDEFKSGWPPMVLEKDAKSLLLRPKDSDQGFVMGNRGGATVRAEDGSYWPFRVVERKPFEPPATGQSK
jgi:hypothetical protein